MNTNTNTLNNIFIKQSELTEKENGEHNKSFALSRTDVASMIPKNCLKQKDIELSKTKTEWRWRIFKLPNKNNETVEISQKQFEQKRLYINNLGNWVECDVDESFDSYVTNEYYYYS